MNPGAAELAASGNLGYSYCMDVTVQTASLSQLTILHTVAIQTQKMAMDSAKTEGNVVLKMIDDLAPATGTNSGDKVNLLA
jgi:hypothetical protein